MSRVFLAAPTPTDISKAAAYGSIVVLLPSAHHNVQDLVTTLAGELDASVYDPAIDYILMAGAMLPTAALLAATLEGYDYARVIVFNARAQAYEVQTVSHEVRR